MKTRLSGLFDTHIHLDQLPDLLAEHSAARDVGVYEFLVPGTFVDFLETPCMLARTLAGCWAAPGLHPMAARDWNQQTAAKLHSLLETERTIAVGEIGLDGSLEIPRDIQEQAFRAQLNIAIDAGRPVLIHCRKAFGPLLEILRSEKASRVGGIMHAFSGSLESAQKAIDLGFAIGISGVITYPNSRRLPQVLKQLPNPVVVLETDAPDIPPHPYQQGTNRPAYLPLIAAKVAEIKGWTLEEAAQTTTANARRILGLSLEP